MATTTKTASTRRGRQQPQHVEPSSRRIVMIDDQASYSDALAMAFDYENRLEVVGQATTSNAGVRIALELQPDLVLCDYRMPGDSSGTECAARLRQFGFYGHIVILTGCPAPDVHAEAARLEDVSVISKSLDVAEIIATITADELVPPTTLVASSGSRVSTQGGLAERRALIGWACAMALVALLGVLALSLFTTEREAVELSEAPSVVPDSRADGSARAPAAVAAGGGQAAASDAGETQVAGTVLTRPFVIIDGASGPLYVTIEVDGVAVDSFTPSNLPATIGLDIETGENVVVTVKNVGAGGTKSCAIGANRELVVTNDSGVEAPAVCSTTLP